MTLISKSFTVLLVYLYPYLCCLCALVTCSLPLTTAAKAITAHSRDVGRLSQDHVFRLLSDILNWDSWTRDIRHNKSGEYLNNKNRYLLKSFDWKCIFRFEIYLFNIHNYPVDRHIYLRVFVSLYFRHDLKLEIKIRVSTLILIVVMWGSLRTLV